MRKENEKCLRVMAQSRADLEIVSTFIQDATIKVCDLAYRPVQHRFAVLVNRYRWETDADGTPRSREGGPKPERVRSGLRFEGVLRAAYQNVPISDPDHVLGLLAIEMQEGDDGAAILTMACSGFASIRLEVECIEVYLEDISRPWRALQRPAHRVIEAGTDD